MSSCRDCDNTGLFYNDEAIFCHCKKGLELKPKPKEFWKHANGNVYAILTITNTESVKPTMHETVVYQDMITGTEWSRPMVGWYKRFRKVE